MFLSQKPCLSKLLVLQMRCIMEYLLELAHPHHYIKILSDLFGYLFVLTTVWRMYRTSRSDNFIFGMWVLRVFPAFGSCKNRLTIVTYLFVNFAMLLKVSPWFWWVRKTACSCSDTSIALDIAEPVVLEFWYKVCLSSFLLHLFWLIGQVSCFIIQHNNLV